jgi:hypothetical protein
MVQLLPFGVCVQAICAPLNSLDAGPQTTAHKTKVVRESYTFYPPALGKPQHDELMQISNEEKSISYVLRIEIFFGDRFANGRFQLAPQRIRATANQIVRYRVAQGTRSNSINVGIETGRFLARRPTQD